jgi:hypothetical protein
MTLDWIVLITSTEGPMAVMSREALWDGDRKVGGAESWEMTTNSTSLMEVRGRADGRLLLRILAPPAKQSG